jgi:hypothetical protein
VFTLLAAFCQLSFSACAVTRHRYSAAYVNDRTVEVHSDLDLDNSSVFKLNDIEFSVRPNNGRFAGVMTLPFPWTSAESKETSTNFHVLVWFHPNRAGFVLRPEKILLSFSPTEVLAPSLITGPHWTGSDIATFNPHAPTFESAVLITGVSYSVEYDFPIPPPDPVRSFSIEIAGLELDGTPYKIPVVTFKQKRTLEPDLPW